MVNNRNSAEVVIKSPEFINPFFMYSLFWILCIVCFLLSPSSLRNNMDWTLALFSFLTIFITLILFKKTKNKLKDKKLLFKYSEPRYIYIAVLIALYILEFMYSENIPFISSIIQVGDSGYNKFGVPTLHVVIVTISIIYGLKNTIDYFLFKRIKNVINTAIVLLYFVLIFSRGVLLLMFFSMASMYLSTRHITRKLVIKYFILTIVVMYVFGVLGNLRTTGEWNNASMILYIANINADPFSTLSPFYWVEEYLCCSLRNLNFTIQTVTPSFSITEMIYTFLPDFISKRMVGNLIIGVNREIDAFTTVTTYGPVYACLGYLGMLLEFVLYVIVGKVITSFKYISNSYRLSSLAVCSFLFGLSIFDAMLQYSGYSFSLFWGVLFGCVAIRWKNGIKFSVRIKEK